MKYLKLYNQMFEGLRDKMTGRSKEDIKKKLESLNTHQLKDRFLQIFFDENHFNAYEKMYSLQDFVDYIEDIIGRNIWKELIDYYGEKYEEDEIDMDHIRENIDEEELIEFTYFTKGELIKLIIATVDQMGFEYMFEGLRHKMTPKSDEHVMSQLDKLSFEEKINHIKEYNLDRKFYPPMRQIEGYLSQFSGGLRIAEIFQLRVFEFLPTKDGYYYIDGNLDLDALDIIKLPDNLHVERNLYCSENELLELPKGLIVGGSLYCQHGKLTEIPSDMEVGKSINLIVNNITEIPENLTVNGDLDLDYNPIEKLPRGLVVKGNLYCVETNLMDLPDDLIVEGVLYTAGSGIRNKLEIKKPIGVNYLDVATRRL